MDIQFSLDRALTATGELLARRGQTAAIVVVGGTALNLLGVIERFTSDVDVIAIGTPRKDNPPKIIGPPDPLPAPLAEDPSPTMAGVLERVIAHVQTSR